LFRKAIEKDKIQQVSAKQAGIPRSMRNAQYLDVCQILGVERRFPVEDLMQSDTKKRRLAQANYLWLRDPSVWLSQRYP
jgi:hypothetical protein